jgi:hypothetical protein
MVFSFLFSSPFCGFEKPELAIPNLAHLFFAKGCKKPNKLNSFPQQIGVLSAQFCASRVRSVKSALPQACGIDY